MLPENNNVNQTDNTISADSTNVPAAAPLSGQPAAPQVPNISAPTPQPKPLPNLPQLETTPNTPAMPPAAHTPAPLKHKKSWLTRAIMFVVFLVILAGVALGAYHVGKGHTKIVTLTPTAQPINLPPQAVVTAACTPGRGKQYIIPKDIPQGPIYDVENSKVIAIEYELNINSLFTNSDSFSNAILNLTKNYPVDHFTIVPDQTASASGQTIHLIMFIVSKDVASKITCSTSSSGSSTPQSTSTTQ